MVLILKRTSKATHPIRRARQERINHEEVTKCFSTRSGIGLCALSCSEFTNYEKANTQNNPMLSQAMWLRLPHRSLWAKGSIRSLDERGPIRSIRSNTHPPEYEAERLNPPTDTVSASPILPETPSPPPAELRGGYRLGEMPCSPS